MQRILTKQQVLDEAIQHMANQNWIPSIDSKCKFTKDHMSCVYRGPNNRKCIIGHFLLGEHYSVFMENECVTTSIVLKGVLTVYE